MITFKNSDFFKPFTFLIALVVFSFSVIILAPPASASSMKHVVENANPETGRIILESLIFNEDQTRFVGFDEEFAKNSGLKGKDFANVDVFLNLDHEGFQLFKNAKLDLERNNSGISLYAGNGLKDILTLATVIAALVVVGQTVIAQMTSDLYKLGAKKFCKSWKNYKAIKNACKDLGYL